MVLADPGFVETEPIEPLHQLQIPVQAGGGVLVHWVKWRQEGPVAQWHLGHAGVSLSYICQHRMGDDVIRLELGNLP